MVGVFLLERLAKVYKLRSPTLGLFFRWFSSHRPNFCYGTNDHNVSANKETQDLLPDTKNRKFCRLKFVVRFEITANKPKRSKIRRWSES